MRFRFKNKSEPFDYVQALVDCMFVCVTYIFFNIRCPLNLPQHYPPEHVLTGMHLTTIFDAELIKNLLLESFSPSNLRIHICSKKFAGSTDQVESWYGTPYSEVPFTKEFIEVRNLLLNCRVLTCHIEIDQLAPASYRGSSPSWS